MSVFDKQFIEQISSILNKNAQDANLANNYKLALKMIDNLSTMQTPAPISPDAGIEDSQPAQSDLYSLDAFVNYLAEKKFRFGSSGGKEQTTPSGGTTTPTGVMIVSPTQTGAPLPQGGVKYESKQPPGLYVVYKQGIIDALIYFRGLAGQSANLYLQELIGNLIDDAKMDRQLYLPAEALTEKHVEKIDDVLGLSDDLLLDTINTKVNVIQELYPDQVKGKITVGDLRDDAFTDFVRRFSISADGTNQYLQLEFGSDNSDKNPICVFLNYLHERAIKAQLQGNLKKYYVSQVERFMGSKSCPIHQTTETQSGQQEQSGGQNQLVSYITKALKQSGGSEDFVLPYDLQTDQFSFAKMEAFAKQVEAVLSVPGIQEEMKYYASALNNYDRLVLDRISQIEASSPQALKRGGFSININTDLRAMAVAAGSFKLLLTFLEELVPLCQYLDNTLQSLYASPTIVQMIGKPAIDAQLQKGSSYMTWIRKYIGDVRNELSNIGKGNI